MKFALVPNGDLTVDPSRSGTQWTVSGQQPGFELVCATGEIPAPGWYLVSTDLNGRMHAENGTHAEVPTLLNFKPESGLFSLAKRPIPVILGRRSRVMVVPIGAAVLELEVSPWTEFVSGTQLTLTPIPSAIAATLMSADIARTSAQGNLDAATLIAQLKHCLLYTSPSPRDRTRSRMPSSA